MCPPLLVISDFDCTLFNANTDDVIPKFLDAICENVEKEYMEYLSFFESEHSKQNTMYLQSRKSDYVQFISYILAFYSEEEIVNAITKIEDLPEDVITLLNYITSRSPNENQIHIVSAANSLYLGHIFNNVSKAAYHQGQIKSNKCHKLQHNCNISSIHTNIYINIENCSINEKIEYVKSNKGLQYALYKKLAKCYPVVATPLVLQDHVSIISNLKSLVEWYSVAKRSFSGTFLIPIKSGYHCKGVRSVLFMGWLMYVQKSNCH